MNETTRPKTTAERQADPNDPWYCPPLSAFAQAERRESVAARDLSLARQARNQARFDKLSHADQTRILDTDRNDR